MDFGNIFSWILDSEQNFNEFLDPAIFHLIGVSTMFLAQIMNFASNTFSISDVTNPFKCFILCSLDFDSKIDRGILLLNPNGSADLGTPIHPFRPISPCCQLTG